LWRERSGEGQQVKVNLLAGMLAHQNQEMVMALNFNEDFQRPRSGIGHPGMDAPFGTYPTRDGWITIAMSPFRTLVGVLGNDDLLRFDDPETLFSERDAVWRALAAETSDWTTPDLIAALLEADIWCGEVKSHLQSAVDPQVEHLGLISSYDHPRAGKVRIVGPAVGLSRTPAKVDRPAPLVGQHTVEVLEEFGLSRPDIDRMIETGAAGQPDRDG
jgi:crotonobetainyl-CoA:carnitine CoA-transferase CaiB-like acyl-CoA transferase